ncbi:RNA-guided endonuclease TnpB family protein [Streptomyces chartreusis]
MDDRAHHVLAGRLPRLNRRYEPKAEGFPRLHQVFLRGCPRLQAGEEAEFPWGRSWAPEVVVAVSLTPQSFVVPAAVGALPPTGRVIGIGWGVKETATTTVDDHDLPHPQHGRTAAQKLARYQRMMARRKPQRGQGRLEGYRDEKRQAAKLHRKVAAQRQDTARKWAKKVVRDHDVLAVEDFRPKFLAKSTMTRKAADATISATKNALVEMARKHGRIVHLVYAAYTTMDRATCGAVFPRDKNSARVMLVRAGLNPAGADLVSPVTC